MLKLHWIIECYLQLSINSIFPLSVVYEIMGVGVVCMYVFLHVCMYASMYVFLCICRYNVCMYLCMYACICVCMIVSYTRRPT